MGWMDRSEQQHANERLQGGAVESSSIAVVANDAVGNDEECFQNRGGPSFPEGVEEPIRGGYHYNNDHDEASPERFETILVSSRRSNQTSHNTHHNCLAVLPDMTETSSSSGEEDDENNDPRLNEEVQRYRSIWSDSIKRWIHRPILYCLRRIAIPSAQCPILTICLVCAISMACLVVGICTNFRIDLSPDLLWTPIGSYPIQHQQYIAEAFPPPPRRVSILVHANGQNVLNKPMLRSAFDIVDIVQSHPEYEALCKATSSSKTAVSILPQCVIYGVSKFWGNNRTVFEMSADDDLRYIIAQERFPDLWPVVHDEILGRYNYSNATTHMKDSAESFTMILSLPEPAMELEVLQAVLALNHENDKESSLLRFEAIAEDSVSNELIRSLNNDIPLVPIIFIAMSLYTMAVFARYHKVFSRSGLGFAAVVAVVLSLATGFGVLFWLGVPFTPITQLLPFLIFSLGLDDCFIIMGAYARTDPRQSVVDRIDAALEDIGLSITLTTLTTATAFALGCFSPIPAIFWLCQYCAPTIVIVFFYQITFFVACIALDERRIRLGRLDLLCCFRDEASADVSKVPQSHFADYVMEWYANQLLRPSVRILAMMGFLVLYGFTCYGASQMTQKFSIAEVLPRDSYVGDYLEASSLYRDASKISIQVVFRDVDQANPFVRFAMVDFAKQLGELDFVEEPEFDRYWMTQFDQFLDHDSIAAQLPFTEALDRFLENPLHKLSVGNDIVRDSAGAIVASRVYMTITVSDDVDEQIRVLNTQHMVSLQQAVNHGREDRLSFFTFAKAYTGFENYSRGVRDLISTAITGVIAVTFVAVIFIPHWSAALVVCPLIIVLYIELLGVMRWGGLFLNSMTSMSMTISIGLLVDFVVHILFRYYEEPGTRQQKTVAMLRTMGSSVLLGGTTTLLGTLPLIFASSDALKIVFVSFLGIVLLGVGHGLILLPVLLATYGPEDSGTPLKKIHVSN